ncbi:DUF2617 family protein [candidate division CSSED10-310 bacterium]|uniref:DUF2617 family protein n=1 Tax=candidate division CSSED10-310 bacterium TaxID=2855610 RepID=A0ABV6YWV5_UNCC1
MIAQVDYKQVSWQQLTLAIFDCVLPEQDFQIIKQQTFQIVLPETMSGHISIRLAVIGASHLVECHCAEQVFTEVFSCRNHFREHPLETIPLGTSHSNWKIRHSTLDYQVCLEHYGQADITPSFLRDFIQPCQEKIWVDFPPGEYDEIPFTAIGAGLDNDQLFIRSIHGYNHEQKIILSSSKCIFRNPHLREH